ncbi:hypothetical protein KAR91_53650 [Candidatus Pacearchaeota archaeon]|nr:hypothetical protein [Candidatus Pacearchaeota archaeon]
MATFLDKIYWGIDSVGNLVPRPTPLDFQYPITGDVRNSTVYGYEDQFTGTAGSGLTPATPLLQSVVDQKDGNTAIATIANSTVGVINYIYGWLSSGGLLTKTLLGQRIGDGDVTITSIAGNYIGIVISSEDNALSLPSDPVAFSISGQYNTFLRDAAAASAVAILSNIGFGTRVTFQNGDNASPVDIWSRINTGNQKVRLRNRTYVGEQVLQLNAPRQDGFPPLDLDSVWNPTATITFNGEIYTIDDVTGDQGAVLYSADFAIICSKNKSGNY